MVKLRLVVALAVFLPALGVRFHPVVSESFQYDSIVTQLAGREGVVANALDSHNTFAIRRCHPPLVAYLVAANNAIVGDGPFAARMFSIVFGALACMMTALAVLVACGRRAPPGTTASPGHASSLAVRTAAGAGAIAGGLTLAFLPVHLYISRTANWDAVYSFFAVSTLTFLAMRLVTSSRPALVAAAVAFALALATCELAIAMVPAVAVAFLLDLRRRGRGVLGQWLVAVVVVAVVTIVIWPAGVFKLDLARMLRFRYQDSALAARNLPWVGFYTTAFSQSRVYCVSAVLALAWLALVAGGVRNSAVTRQRFDPVLRALLPFAVYAATVVILSTRQRLVWIHHIADLFPALSVLMGAALALALGEAQARTRVIALAAAAVLLVGSIAPGLESDPEVVGPQEHPGFVGAGEFFDRHPGARVYCHYTTPLTFYSKDIIVVGPPEKVWTEAALVEAKEGAYDYVVSDRTMLGPLVPDNESLARTLAPEYELVHTVFHRRTGEPVLWIYGTQERPRASTTAPSPSVPNAERAR